MSCPDLNAGADYLQMNINNWAEIHRLNETNSSLVQNIDSKMTAISEDVSVKMENSVQLSNQIKSLPELSSTVSQLCELLGSLAPLCQDIHKIYDEMVDINEYLALEEKKLDCRNKLADYKQKRLDDLENMRESLHLEHLKKVKQREEQISQLLAERQEVCQRHFEEDLNNYRVHGKLPSEPVVRSSDNTVTLESVCLEQDSSVLENFLNSIEESSVHCSDQEHTVELHDTDAKDASIVDAVDAVLSSDDEQYLDASGDATARYEEQKSSSDSDGKSNEIRDTEMEKKPKSK